MVPPTQFGSSVARLPGIRNGRKQLEMERTATSNSLVPFQPFQPD